ncbi:MAG: hypothetical protein A2Y31_04450 [Spirochaetes bacterium GWC2_52_13]|nr:MAG: hypothetical protein A2Y31_04450 [Spirochaetes bacterium GWC2_52_13]
MSIVEKGRTGKVSMPAILAAGLVLAVVLFGVGCAGSGRIDGKTPGWVNSLYDSRYDEKTFLCAVGTGSTRENAVNAAFSSLSQVFNARVESTVSHYTTSTASSTGGEVTFTDSDSLVDQGSLTTETDRIVGGQVVNTWVAPDSIVWVRVAIDRKKTAQLYEKDMAAIEQEVGRIRMAAAREESAVVRFFSLLPALKPALRHQQMSEQVRLLTGTSKTSLLQAIERELDVLAQGITLGLDVRVASTGDVLAEQQITSAKSQLSSAFGSLFTDYGFEVSDSPEAGNTSVLVEYTVLPVPQANGPYANVRYTLSVQVKDGRQVLASYQKEQRETAMTMEDAIQRALRSALHEAVGGLGLALQGSEAK